MHHSLIPRFKIYIQICNARYWRKLTGRFLIGIHTEKKIYLRLRIYVCLGVSLWKLELNIFMCRNGRNSQNQIRLPLSELQTLFAGFNSIRCHDTFFENQKMVKVRDYLSWCESRKHGEINLSSRRCQSSRSFVDGMNDHSLRRMSHLHSQLYTTMSVRKASATQWFDTYQRHPNLRLYRFRYL